MNEMDIVNNYATERAVEMLKDSLKPTHTHASLGKQLSKLPTISVWCIRSLQIAETSRETFETGLEQLEIDPIHHTITRVMLEDYLRKRNHSILMI